MNKDKKETLGLAFNVEENTDMLELARSIAFEAHDGQQDKAGKNYILHPIRVAEKLHTFCSEVQIVALLHDTIEDTFVTPEFLKEKGFDWECKTRKFYPEPEYDAESPNGVYAPTLQMAMKWLREKGIYITIVYGDYPSLNKVFWTPQIDSLEGFDLPDSFYKEYDKYEEAVEAAIKYALENLI